MPVPLGSQIFDDETGECLGEILQASDRLRVAAGGSGGLGNVHFKSSTNRAPRESTPGQAGDCRILRLTLKLMADVGWWVCQMPGNPWSGLFPRLPLRLLIIRLQRRVLIWEVVSLDASRQFVLADIPGLVAGASSGVGGSFLASCVSMSAVVA